MQLILCRWHELFVVMVLVNTFRLTMQAPPVFTHAYLQGRLLLSGSYCGAAAWRVNLASEASRSRMMGRES
jgi:hypothetical protein